MIDLNMLIMDLDLVDFYLNISICVHGWCKICARGLVKTLSSLGLWLFHSG